MNSPEKQFKSVEEELAYLRERFNEKKGDYDNLSKLNPTSLLDESGASRDFSAKSEKEVIS